MTQQTLWLYVIELEQDKYFLYDTYCTDEFEVLVLAHMNHDYLKKYKPIDIKEILILEDHIEILYYLKRYMAAYGIDAVRGGPYTQEYLTKEEEDFLEKELSVENRDKKESHIKQIIQKYGTKRWSQFEIDEEVRLLESIKESYRKDLNNINRLGWIKDSILFDIEWLRNICCQCSNTKPPYLYIYKEFFYKKYHRIIENLKRITELYFIYNEGCHIENSVFLKYPEFIFDLYVFMPSSAGYVPSQIDDLCDQFEVMANTLINRRMEYQFHIDGYEVDIEWKIERSIYFLTNYSRYII